MGDVLTKEEALVVNDLREWCKITPHSAPTNELVSVIDRLVSEVERLRAEVREWLCDKCNHVYPGPPQDGVRCVICTKCGGACGPKLVIEIRRLRARNEALEQVAKAAESIKCAGPVEYADRVRLSFALSALAELGKGGAT